jgi:hypothetical protein
MPIPAQFNVPGYRGGMLSQQCEACRWWQIGHSREVIDCPLCGHRLGAKKQLTFGGLSLDFDGKGVTLTVPYQSCGLKIQGGDLPDTIQFLCSLIDDWRSPGDWQPPWGIRHGVGDMPEPRHWVRARAERKATAKAGKPTAAPSPRA